jgi:hypothetical protein
MARAEKIRTPMRDAMILFHERFTTIQRRRRSALKCVKMKGDEDDTIKSEMTAGTERHRDFE